MYPLPSEIIFCWYLSSEIISEKEHELLNTFYKRSASINFFTYDVLWAVPYLLYNTGQRFYDFVWCLVYFRVLNIFIIAIAIVIYYCSCWTWRQSETLWHPRAKANSQHRRCLPRLSWSCLPGIRRTQKTVPATFLKHLRMPSIVNGTNLS